MSEYQYYEFVALDRPLSRTQMQQLRAISTRAVITSTSFVNHYEWGDLKGDPDAMMERYFDAFLYLANWGTHRVMLRLPTRQLSLDIAADYCAGDSAQAWTTGRNLILDLCSEDYDGDLETDGEGVLASIVPVRDELASGDLRALYLAWLAGVGAESDDEELEPPVPDGLDELSAAGQALAEYLRVDEDLLAEAAAPDRSPRPVTERPAPPAADFARWVAELPPVHEDPELQRLVRDGADLHAALLRRYHEASAPGGTPASRTVGELLAGAAVRREERHRLEREHAAAEQERRRRAETEAREERKRAEATAREKRLVTLAKRVPQAWEQVEELIATRLPGDYDAAVGILVDLHVLSRRTRTVSAFKGRIGELRQRHARKSSLLGRMARAGLPR